MINQFVYTTANGPDFITHEDQEVSNLSFQIHAIKDGFQYVEVKGDDVAVEEWIARVSGHFINQAGVQAVVNSLKQPLEIDEVATQLFDAQTEGLQTQLNLEALNNKLLTAGVIS